MDELEKLTREQLIRTVEIYQKGSEQLLKALQLACRELAKNNFSTTAEALEEYFLKQVEESVSDETTNKLDKPNISDSKIVSCPNCGYVLSKKHAYCPLCNQKLNWKGIDLMNR